MAGVCAYADAEAAAALVAARVRGVREVHGALVAAGRYNGRLRRPLGGEGGGGCGKVFARLRAESFVAVLEVRGAEIARLGSAASESCLVCQQLVDELQLAAAAVHPAADRVRALVSSCEEDGLP